MMHANFTALSSVLPVLVPIEVLHCGIREFDLDLDPMTVFIYAPVSS